MLYLVEVELETNSGTKRHCGRYSDTLDETFPEISVLITGFAILQNILPILLLLHILIGRRICGCTELEARSSRKVLKCSDISIFN